MSFPGNHLDVSGTVDVTDPASVNAEVRAIHDRLYPGYGAAAMDQAFRDFESLYRGRFPGFHACDTPYHDVQHVLDVTLAMARLLDGHERREARHDRYGTVLFQLGVVTALFHDAGYLRSLEDRGHRNGAELTLTHVSRGARFLRWYLPRIGMGPMAEVAAALIHFTGFEIPVDEIAVPSPRFRRLGHLLGTADIIAQMADRCYLEKCRDRLYPEFLVGGIAEKRQPDGSVQVVFESGPDLVYKTPKFFEGAARRLTHDLAGAYRYASYHFGGGDLYIDEIRRNVSFARSITLYGNAESLQRRPPVTLLSEADDGDSRVSPDSAAPDPGRTAKARNRRAA